MATPMQRITPSERPTERWTPSGPVRSEVPFDLVQQEEGRAAASVAEAAPLGLFGFATGTFTIATILAGWFPPATILYASAVVFIFGGLAQFIAAMWSFRKGDLLGATAFGSFGAFNTFYVLHEWMAQARLIVGPGYGLGVVGVAIACFSLIALLLMFAALWRNLALVAVLAWLSLGYGLVAASDIAAAAPNIMHFGGWALIASAMIAFYTAGAMVVNSLSQRQILPLGPALARTNTVPDSTAEAPRPLSPRP